MSFLIYKINNNKIKINIYNTQRRLPLSHSINTSIQIHIAQTQFDLKPDNIRSEIHYFLSLFSFINSVEEGITLQNGMNLLFFLNKNINLYIQSYKNDIGDSRNQFKSQSVDDDSMVSSLSEKLKKQTSDCNSKEEDDDCYEDEINDLSDDVQTNEKDDESQPNNTQNEKIQISIQSINSNIFKNVLKSFFNFLTDIKNKEIIHEFVSKKPYAYTIKIIKKFIKQYKFNNYFLVRLLKNKGYLKVLEYYLTFDVSDWMTQSKIVDVQTHYKCIEFLKECCVNKKIIDTINTYKKKP